MQLDIVAYPPYRAGLGAGTVHLEMPEGSTLRDVLRVLARRSQQFEPWSTAHKDEWLWGQLLVHVKGEMVRLAERLPHGDCLELVTPVAGGQMAACGWRSARMGAGRPSRCRT